MTREQLPEFLCCPECRAEQLQTRDDLAASPAPFDSCVGVRCTPCGREYPYVDGVWVMWSDEIKALQISQTSGSAEANLQVKRANIEVYRQVAEDYGERQEHQRNRYLSEIAQLKQLAKEHLLNAHEARGQVVVDVACATGVGMMHQPLEGASVVGVDISLENLKVARKKGIIPILADAERLPFRGNSIDMITCFAAMHHFPQPLNFLKSCNECLRPGGVCLTSADPTKTALRLGPLARLAFELRRPIYRLLARLSPRYHFHQNESIQKANELAECQRTRGGFDTAQLAQWLSDAGFSFREVFLDISPHARQIKLCPNWKTCALKILSLQNPFLLKNYASVSTLSRK